MAGQDRIVTARITTDTFNKLLEVAIKDERTVSNYIRKLINESVNGKKNET